MTTPSTDAQFALDAALRFHAPASEKTAPTAARVLSSARKFHAFLTQPSKPSAETAEDSA